MLNFKKEYFKLEENRQQYATSFSDLMTSCEVYGKKQNPITSTAFIFLIPKDYYTYNAGNIDFTNYTDGIWNDYTDIKIVKSEPYFDLDFTFNSTGDITPENLNQQFKKIKDYFLETQKEIVEKQAFLDSGIPEQLGLPKLPIGCIWYQDTDGLVALPISKCYSMFEELINNLKKILEIYKDDLKDELRKNVDDLIEEMTKEKDSLILLIQKEGEKQVQNVTDEGEKQLEILNQASEGLPNRVTEIEKNIETFKMENETQHQELADDIRTARTESIPATRLEDNSLSAKKLKTSTDSDKIKMENLSDEVKQAMTGKTPVSPSLTDGSVVREYIADGAVDITKIDNSFAFKEYDININKTFGKITFLIYEKSRKNITISDLIEIKFYSNINLDAIRNKGYIFKLINVAGSITNINPNYCTITKIEENLYMYSLKGNPAGNLELSKINYGDSGSGQVFVFDGKFYNFEIKVNGENLSFTFENPEEEIQLVKSCKIPIDFETVAELIRNKIITLDNFSKIDKNIILGKTQDNYEIVIEKLTGTQNRHQNKLAIPNIKLKAGKYRLNTYGNNLNYLIYTFPTSRGGIIQQVFKIEKMQPNTEIIIENDCYVGIQNFSGEQATTYWYGTGTKYKTNFYETTTIHNVGEELLVNQTDRAISSTEYYTCPIQFEYTPVYSLNAKENTNNLNITANELSDKINNISYKNISDIPSENKEILYRIENIKDVLYDERFNYNNISDNTMRDFSIFLYKNYQAVDEFTYRIKFKLNSLDTILGITSYNGEYENRSLTLDISNKTIIFGNAVGINPMQTLELTDEDYIDMNDRISTIAETPNIDIGIEFEIGNYYQLELIRSGLKMTVNVYDFKNDKLITSSNYDSRFHGGLGVFTQQGEIEMINIEHLSALKTGAKAIFIGDSITEGLEMGTNDISKRWASLIRDKYFKGNAICSGMGWGKTGNVKTVLDSIKAYCDYISYYFVMIGTNQSGADGSGYTVWEKEIVEIHDKIIELGGIPVIICPPLRKGTDNNVILFKMRDFILEKGWNTIRMDIATSTGDGITFDSSLSTDGVHFNEAGNQKMYERALIDLKKIM